MENWSPAAGVLVLLEPTTGGRADGLCLTGTVTGSAPGPDSGLIIDLGASPELPRSPCDVAASFYAPDGFYRVEARAEELGDGDILVSFAADPDRLAGRARTVMPVAIAVYDGSQFQPTQGETLDLSASGCRVHVPDRLPAAPTVAVGFGAANGPLVLQATMREEVHRSDGWEYRLAFEHVDDDTRRRVNGLVGRAGADVSAH
jgi:PilZ domain-containing protein